MATQNQMHYLHPGDRCPTFELAAGDGQRYNRSSFHDKAFLVVIFTAVNCRYVDAWNDRIVAISHEFTSHDVAFIAIDPTPDPGQAGERAGAPPIEYPFPYLFDQDQSVARSFGASHTPEVFVFDQERVLRYHGAVDSDPEESSGMQHYLREALDRLTHGALPYLPETPLVGCPITYDA